MSYILYMACIVKVINLQEIFDEEVIVPELNQKDDSRTLLAQGQRSQEIVKNWMSLKIDSEVQYSLFVFYSFYIIIVRCWVIYSNVKYMVIIQIPVLVSKTRMGSQAISRAACASFYFFFVQ